MIEQSLNSAFSFKEINAYIILAFFSMVFSKTGSLYRTKTVSQIKDKKKKRKKKKIKIKNISTLKSQSGFLDAKNVLHVVHSPLTF